MIHKLFHQLLLATFDIILNEINETFVLCFGGERAYLLCCYQDFV